MVSSRRLIILAVFGVVALVGVASGVPLESTTVGILKPPTVDDDDDAVIIEAGGDAGAKDTTPETFNTGDCLLPKSKGPCRAAIESYFYSTVTKGCERFVWSGCGGNNNRFSEKEFCETHCSKDKVTSGTAVPILFPGKKGGNSTCPEFQGCGPLKCATIKDPETGCEKCSCATSSQEARGPIGSVSGNPDTEPSKPVGKPEDVCNLPETRGDCRAMLTRWRYNPEIKECVQFHFGGCDGNSNNFVSQEKCSVFCKGQ